jgi:hypothetical protein
MLYVRHINTIITERFQRTFFQHSLFRFAVFNKTLYRPAVFKLCSADRLVSDATWKFTRFLIKEKMFR